MSLKIEYEDKINIQNDETILEKNKVTDENMNEIKNVVNNHADNINDINNFIFSDFNILRGVEEAEGLHNNLYGSWSEGGWGQGTATIFGEIERIDIENPPNYNIRKGWHIISRRGKTNISQSGIPLISNQMYCFSCYAKGTVRINLGFENEENGISHIEIPLESETEWKKYSHSFKATGESRILFGAATDGAAGSENSEVYICGMRLEAIKPSENGKSAYELAVENGFIGTIQEWLESLHGQDGQAGANGQNGENGTDGYTPVKGVDYFTAEDKEELIGEISDNKINDETLKLPENIKIVFNPENGQSVANWQGCYYYKKGSKVTLHIGINLGTTQRLRIFTMPAGFRPGGTIPVWGGGADGGVPDQSFAEIFANGEVYVKAPSKYILAVVEYDVFGETAGIATMNLNNAISNIETRFEKSLKMEEI